MAATLFKDTTYQLSTLIDEIQRGEIALPDGIPAGPLRQDIRQVNQIANMALVDWWENIGISDDAPAEYWPKYATRMESERLSGQMRDHALPEGWHEMDYPGFLEARRQLIADVIRRGFERLRS